MSKPRYRWWSYVKAVIRNYPKLKKELEEMQRTSLVANYTGMPHTGGISDPTANAALRQLGRDEQREYDAVCKAVQQTMCAPNGKQRLEIIRLVYWTRSHTVDGAGAAVGYGAAQARRINGQFICLTAKNLGLIGKDDTPEPKKCD